ncbi:hypothetical protein AAFF_G00234330 [Aldrovandia affinis]|uniref:Uncharacterized protein n=1 Tax=Aldrovandia affinis TaxID=143900 RepID=A0AAD7SV40_9TELE|nr:hypothetical protein AAFF_G00234330 [Aldrovandia affinis]
MESLRLRTGNTWALSPALCSVQQRYHSRHISPTGINICLLVGQHSASLPAKGRDPLRHAEAAARDSRRSSILVRRGRKAAKAARRHVASPSEGERASLPHFASSAAWRREVQRGSVFRQPG